MLQYINTYCSESIQIDKIDEEEIIRLNNMISNIHISDMFTTEEDPDDIVEDDITDTFPLSKDIDEGYDPLEDIHIEGSME